MWKFQDSPHVTSLPVSTNASSVLRVSMEIRITITED
jgi:hypothetical protein